MNAVRLNTGKLLNMQWRRAWWCYLPASLPAFLHSCCWIDVGAQRQMTYPPVRWHDVACSDCCNEAQRLAVQQAGQMPPAHPHTPPTLSPNRLPTHTPPTAKQASCCRPSGWGCTAALQAASAMQRCCRR